MNGGPTDWSAAIGALDTRYFQPWILYYPSGLRLDMVSDYLVSAIADLRKAYDFSQLYVVAHSMGGLVARSFVKKYLERFPDNSGLIRLVITVNSPMDGMSSAVRGVQNSPIVVPAWRDLAEGSDFLGELNSWPWPEEIPYHLVFSYTNGRSGDGVVPLQSQIPLQLQSEAVRTYGFNNSHAGVLSDEAFLEQLGVILAGEHATTRIH
jgi:pimeloyl-ACP methyl ester carboxylesterase